MPGREILTIDSTKGGSFHATVRKQARGQQLQGSLCCVEVQSPGGNQRVLCQIGMVDTVNPMHENEAFAPFIMADGFIPHFSREADIERTVLKPLACLDLVTGKASGRKANPHSGTPAYIAEAVDLEAFRNEKEYYLNIGYQPGYPDTVMSIICRHNGNVTTGGYGEGQHRLIVGQNGSGKTVLASQGIAGRAVLHKGKMGVLIPDTKGDFVADGKHHRGDYHYSFRKLLEAGGVTPTVIKFDNIRLDSLFLLGRLLAEHLFRRLSSTQDKVADFFGQVLTNLNHGKETIDRNADWFTWEGILGKAAEMAPNAWSEKKSGGGKQEALRDLLSYPECRKSIWERTILPYFSGDHHANHIGRMVLSDHKVVILDMVDGRCPPDRQDAIMSGLFNALKWQAREAYTHAAEGEYPVNAEIVIDEAPRWVPEGDHRDKGAAGVITDAVNTTRAYSLSWTFISQRLATINKSIVSQAHTKWLGRNIGVGADRGHMKDLLGESGLALYEQLQLQDEKFFLGIGNEVNLGAGQVPVALIGWGGDATQKLQDMNPHIWKRSPY